MHSDERRTTALVEAARAGDAHARDALVRAYLPLVHNIVGRALDGHADTDDIVQETMVRALDGLTGLRDPARFRSWLVAIAMNGIRRRWREQRQDPVPGLDRAADLADPAGDFTELTILRLGLSGQRREVARATRWLDGDDRELLALWWLEAAGELTRAELAEGLGGISPQHAAVRVQRMKERLETGRAVVRALDAAPVCPDLAETLTAWDGRPSPLWRKRVARHLRTCAACAGPSAGRGGLAPVEGLLVGIGLVPPLALTFTHGESAGAVAWESAGHAVPVGPAGQGRPVEPVPLGSLTRGVPPEPPTGPGGRWTPVRRSVLAGAAAVAVLGAVALLVPPEPHARVAPAAPPATRTPVPTWSAPAPAPAPRPTVTAHRPAPTSAPPASPSPVPPAPSAEEQVTGLVNRLRAAAGCAPLRVDSRLSGAARAHARDMAARGYYGHASPEGDFADARITAAGYDWSAWAENLDRGTTDPASVVDDWTDGAAHEENMLDCRYRDTGVASVPGPRGTIWVQKLAAPAH
ncbi:MULTISPECIES: sigma-70 family RNA polymerase sigma factor [unclassified Streptomyces]|uniref:sigma-70 family RNA polymerase sigma factor n=1 Tax=unclassified Streptomyces TaxID=2593676 RepID=UPI0006FE4F3D|nr:MULTISPECIES: sigma-70 family RNA polymerase sigma factor [unclassified Streptomyces]KQX49854.1 RNA polymerase subunit sigma [Streptomyces sp. Root1304]KRA80103.1 RNA polymerase subunit sigma [Streptomyces sp. Root66D1]